MNQIRMNQADGNWLETGEMDRISPALGLVRKVASGVRARLEEEMKALGLSGSRFGVLHHLLRAGEPVPLRVLAKAQKCVPSYITNIIDRLEADGLVRRIDDPFDRRSRRARLTTLGEIRAREGVEAMARFSRQVESALRSDGVAAIERLERSLSGKLT